jgi:hypothetical protein
MILKLLIANRKAGYILIPVVVLFVWAIHSFLNPETPPGDQGSLTGLLGYTTLFENVFVGRITFFVLLLLNGILVVRINRQYVLSHSKSVLPAIIFIFLTSVVPGYRDCYTVWISVTFLLIGIEFLFVSFDERKPYSWLFNAGFFLGVASCFYIDLVVLVPAFMIGGWFLARDSHWREYLLPLMGFLVPWILVPSVYFLTDHTPRMIGVFLFSIHSGDQPFFQNTTMVVFLSFLAFFTILGSYKMILVYDEKKISYRKYFILFFIMFISLVLAFILVPAVTGEIFTVSALPVSFLLSNFFDSVRRPLVSEIMFLLFLAVVFYLQFS